MNTTQPKLSIIVIGYKMARQFANTLYTFSTDYQQNVQADDYEVIAVENESDENFDEEYLKELKGNFRYFRRQETTKTPVHAINFAFEQSRGHYVGLLIDGARMVTPRVVEHVLMATQWGDNNLIIVPGYHLGPEPQYLSAQKGYNQEVEQKMLTEAKWSEDGYNLFEICCFSEANPHSYLHPMTECNCLFATKENFQKIGFADERFDLRGGGAVNLHMFRKLGMLPNMRPVVLHGEGSFHQYHGGVTTSDHDEVADEKKKFGQHLQGLWDGEFRPLRKEPTLLGTVSPQAAKYLTIASQKAEKRFKRLKWKNEPFWEDDD